MSRLRDCLQCHQPCEGLRINSVEVKVLVSFRDFWANIPVATLPEELLWLGGLAWISE
jgi:hypothetical protein